jgi:hypothetical protein
MWVRPAATLSRAESSGSRTLRLSEPRLATATAARRLVTATARPLVARQAHGEENKGQKNELEVLNSHIGRPGHA